MSLSSHVIYLNLPGSRHIAGGARLNHDAGDGIRHVVVRAGRVINTVAAASSRATFQTDELPKEPLVIQKVALLGIDDRQQIPINVVLSLFADLVINAVHLESFSRPLARISVAADCADPVDLQECGEF